MGKRGHKNYNGIDFTGFKHNRLTVVRKADFGISQWVCRCECGNEITAPMSKILNLKSCGCLEKENLNIIKHSAVTHGMTDTRLYRTWCGMKGRCNNPNAPHYERYGGRGIKMCEKWMQDFSAFAEWAFANGYNPDSTGHEQSIDRIDPNGDYDPSNCRWVSQLQQARNRSDTVYVVFNGNRITMSEFCEINSPCGITRVYAFRHIKKGQTGEEILNDWENRRQKGKTIHK